MNDLCNAIQGFSNRAMRFSLSFVTMLLLLASAGFQLANAQTINLNGDWVGYYADGTKSTFVWRIVQNGASLAFEDVGAGTNTKFSGQLANGTITDSNKITGTISADGTQIAWSDGVIWKRPLFADGSKINLFADNGYRMTRCNGCQDTLNNAVPDTVILGSDGETQFSTFVVKNDPASGKVMLQADTGKMLTYCNGCITGGAVYAEQFVVENGDSNNPWNKFELAKLSNGKYTLKAPNGKYLSRCDGCSPSLQKRTRSTNGNVVMPYIADPNSIYAQWTITLPGTAGPKIAFSMIFASDPQIGYCDPPQCASNAKEAVRWDTALKANWKHRESILRRMDALRDVEGVIVNGDLTNTMEFNQLEQFRLNYVNSFKTYPGLGNHDYVNYTPAGNDSTSCEFDGSAIAKHACFRRIAKWVAGWVRALDGVQDFDWSDSDTWKRTGSLSYWWDVAGYRFVQLNWNPAYEMKLETFVSTKAGHEEYSITSSMDWLKKVLDKSSGQTVILNMHGIHSLDSLSPDSSKYSQGYTELQKLLDKYPNVGVIFAGHIHHWAGDQAYYNQGRDFTNPNNQKRGLNSASYTYPIGTSSTGTYSVGTFSTTCGRQIPVLFNGSAIFNLYLSAKFESDKLTWTVVDSRQGTVNELDTGSVSFPLRNPAGCP